MAAMKGNEDTLETILFEYMKEKADAEYDTDAIRGLKAMINDIQKSVDYIDDALRQVVVAVAAANISDANEFTTVKKLLTSKSTSLSELLAQNDALNPPPEFSETLNAYDALENSVAEAGANANALISSNKEEYTWAEVKPIFESLIDISGDVFINDKRVSEMSSADATSLLNSAIDMTLAGGSGVFSDIANFTGDYSGKVEIIKTANVTVMGSVDADKAYLVLLLIHANGLTANDGSTSTANAELTSTYGYILDLAFRCNAPISDLLLQTDATQRVYEDSTSPSTSGGGSYMEFPLNAGFDVEQTTKLIDAVRVAFVDDQNNILGVAKLNTSNRAVADNVIKAPLYLYEYSLSESPEDYGAMIMGERKKETNVIASLTQNVAKSVSVVVWLDGDIVDNTVVSAESDTSVSGVLNLQFASSADLVPAGNSDLMNMTPDKTSLKKMIADNELTYNAGQGMHTTASWNTFTKAYEYAVKIYEDSLASDVLIYRAMRNLEAAQKALALTTAETLTTTIAELRELMGTTDEPARYIVAEGDKYLAVNPHNVVQELDKLGELFAVDKDKNLHDEGNGLYTPVYTDASWEALADALYNAELLKWQFDNDKKDENTLDIDNAISELELAKASLIRKIFYEPYDYEGVLYFAAVTEDKDTYGKWYDYAFKRVVADLRIIELDRYAVPVNLFTITLPKYAENANDVNGTFDEGRTEFVQLLSGTIDFNNSLYTSLKNEKVEYFTISDLGIAVRAMTDAQRQTISRLLEEIELLSDKAEGGEDIITEANAVLSVARKGRFTSTYAEANKVIFDMNVFLAASRNTAALETMKKDLLPKLDEAYEAAKGYEQIPVYNPVLDEEGNPVIDEETGVAKQEEVTTEYYEKLNAAIEEKEGLTETSDLADVISAFDRINDALVEYAIREAVPYPTYELANSAHGDKPVYRNDDTADFLVPVPDYAEAESWRINVGEIFVVTTNGILGYAAPQTISIYERANGAILTDKDGAEIPETTAGLNVKGGETLQLGATVFYEDDDGNKLEELPVWAEPVTNYIWTSSDSDILTVDGNGKITPKKEGTATITVSIETAAGNNYVFSIRVTADGFGTVSGPGSLAVGDMTKLTFTAGDISDTSLTYRSTDKTVLTVNESGHVTAVAPGSATVIVTVRTATGAYELRHDITVN